MPQDMRIYNLTMSFGHLPTALTRRAKKELKTQSMEQLYNSAKVHGLSIYERLLLLETNLNVISVALKNSSRKAEYFDLEAMKQQCVPHPDGTPKHPVYLATYRVLEHLPLGAINSMWLATKDGRELILINIWG